MRRYRLHVVAVAWLGLFAGLGTWLITIRGLVPFLAGDCPLPINEQPCMTFGHPHSGWGVFLWLVGLVGGFIISSYAAVKNRGTI